MASLSRSSDGKFTIQFIDANDKRKSIRLGAVPKRMAESVKGRVESLLNAKITNTLVDRDTAAWLSGVGADLADKLATVGLIEARNSSTLAEFASSYVQGRTDVNLRPFLTWNAPPFG